MKILAINGSPRKNKNTAMLLEHALKGAASVGAETELAHLYGINYKGCTSCFACKLKNRKINGLCTYRDDLSPLLEKAMAADVILLGSPIYFQNVTGQMRSFMERLMFPIHSYLFDTSTGVREEILNKVIPVGFIYTMNVNEKQMNDLGYPATLSSGEHLFRELFGHFKSMYCNDTYQFNDYSKYDMNIFDEKLKAEVKDKQFPVDCQKAFDLGVSLMEAVGKY